MLPVSRLTICSAAIAFSAISAFAQQNVISAKSGLVHYIEGEVAVDGAPVADKAGVFINVKKDSALTTALGRAEILMTPGVFLRVGEQSGIRMLGTSLSDTRVELLTGNAMLESDTPMKDNLVTVFYKDYATTFPKHGLYEFRSEPAQLKVFKGDAVVTTGGQSVTVHEGHTMYLTAALAQEKFNSDQGDSLYRWAKTRSEYVSTANVSAAQSAQSLGFGNGYGNGFNSAGIGGLGGSWFYNSSYGMYTYLPFQGTAFSPFGYSYFSPFTVSQAFAPYGGGYGGGGSTTSGLTHSTRSAVLSTSSSAVSSPSTGRSAPVASTAVSSGSASSGHIGAAGGAGGRGTK